jgi:hypothetical protein
MRMGMFCWNLHSICDLGSLLCEESRIGNREGKKFGENRKSNKKDRN